MKSIANVFRILVGGLFIFSGFVKLVDPVGTGIKLHEYFDVFASDLPALTGFFSFFSHNSLPLSLFFCAFEVILGFCLLFKFRMNLTIWLSLLMMGFFTFLTFYTAFFNKVTDCGCFGDFLKLKPWTSFWKDVVLSIMILVMFAFRNSFENLKTGAWIALFSGLSFAIGLHAIYYLPTLDFLPYAVGKNIKQQMIPAEKPILKFIMKKDGKEIEMDEFPTDTTYKYVSSYTVNEDASRAKITDYSFLNQNSEDVKDSTFVGKKALLLIRNDELAGEADFTEVNKILQGVASQGIEPMILTSMSNETIDALKKEKDLSYKHYIGDEKVLKTMARSNPVLMILKDGTVKAKWSNLEMPEINEVLEELK
jgi:hypothetical protein